VPREEAKRVASLTLENALVIGELMMRNLDIRDRASAFRTHARCFVGREAVEWMLSQKFVSSVEQAVETGNMLIRANVISHVTNGHMFSNSQLLYRFTTHAAGGQFLKQKPTDSDLLICSAMMKNLELKDLIQSEPFFQFLMARKPKIIRHCFAGTQAVQWLLNQRIATSESDALRIGNRLLETGLVRQMDHTHSFLNKKELLYFFVAGVGEGL